MGDYEDLANFKARYDRAVSNWITFKNTVMTNAELAWRFFERLGDSIYFEFKCDVNNSLNVSKSISAEKMTLVELMNMLREYEPNKLDYKFRVNGAVYRARTEEEEQS